MQDRLLIARGEGQCVQCGREVSAIMKRQGGEDTTGLVLLIVLFCVLGLSVSYYSFERCYHWEKLDKVFLIFLSDNLLLG